MAHGVLPSVLSMCNPASAPEGPRRVAILVCEARLGHAPAGERATCPAAGAGLSPMSESGFATPRSGAVNAACRRQRSSGIKGLAGQSLDGPGAGGSNTRPSVAGGQGAQLVEQRTENPRVGGSIPPLATIKLNIINNFAAAGLYSKRSNTHAA